MVKRHRGKPIITLRLDAGRIAALKMAANRHNTTVSDMLRDLIDDQLHRDGIKPVERPIDGQITM